MGEIHGSVDFNDLYSFLWCDPKCYISLLWKFGPTLMKLPWLIGLLSLFCDILWAKHLLLNDWWLLYSSLKIMASLISSLVLRSDMSHNGMGLTLCLHSSFILLNFDPVFCDVMSPPSFFHTEAIMLRLFISSDMMDLRSVLGTGLSNKKTSATSSSH